jgi:hypothetical protein
MHIRAARQKRARPLQQGLFCFFLAVYQQARWPMQTTAKPKPAKQRTQRVTRAAAAKNAQSAKAALQRQRAQDATPAQASAPKPEMVTRAAAAAKQVLAEHAAICAVAPIPRRTQRARNVRDGHQVSPAQARRSQRNAKEQIPARNVVRRSNRLVKSAVSEQDASESDSSGSDPGSADSSDSDATTQTPRTKAAVAAAKRKHLPAVANRTRSKAAAAAADKRRHTRKNFTGAKLMIDSLGLKIHPGGGIYCFLPYEKVDSNNKCVVKIGQTSNFQKRIKQYHTYFPLGVYMIGFLINPPYRKVDKVKRKKGEPKAKLPSAKTSQYLKIESFIIDKLKGLEKRGKAKIIYSTTHVKRPNASGEGETEWIYTSAETIHQVFKKAREEFTFKIGDKRVHGGVAEDGDLKAEMKLYFLKGLDPQTGRELWSINQLAANAEKDKPNYEARIIFRT